MTNISKFIYGLYEQKRDSLEASRTVSLEFSETCNKLNDLLNKNEYGQIFDAFSNEADERAEAGYEQGFKDGMRFLVSMITVM